MDLDLDLAWDYHSEYFPITGVHRHIHNRNDICLTQNEITMQNELPFEVIRIILDLHGDICSARLVNRHFCDILKTKFFENIYTYSLNYWKYVTPFVDEYTLTVPSLHNSEDENYVGDMFFSIETSSNLADDPIYMKQTSL